MAAYLKEIDHLVYVVEDLEQAMDNFEAQTGVRPVIGGQHLGEGTWNALFSLGPDIYFEIIAADPAQEKPDQYSWQDAISGKGYNKLIRWAASGKQLEVKAKQALTHGIDLGQVMKGSRKKSDGSTLSWTLTDLKKDPLDGVIPFFLDWSESVHPSASLPQGCELLSLTVYHPNAAQIRTYFEQLDLHIPVEESNTISLKAKLATPKGIIEV